MFLRSFIYFLHRDRVTFIFYIEKFRDMFMMKRIDMLYLSKMIPKRDFNDRLMFQPSWSIVDPICTFLFSILVMLTTVAIIKDVVNVLMEGIPKGFEYSQVESTFMQIDGVVKVHNLRIWALSLDKTALSAHLAISTYTQKYNPTCVLLIYAF